MLTRLICIFSSKMAFSLARRIYSRNHLSNYFSQAFSKCLLAFDYDDADFAASAT